MDVRAGDMGRVRPGWIIDHVPTGNDDGLVARAKAGDLEAFDRLMESHQARVYRTALALLGQHHDALDAVQEVFLRLFRYIATFDDSKPLEPWLYRMTVNVSRDSMRKRRRQVWLGKVGLRRDEVVPAKAVETLAFEEELTVLKQCLRRLPEKERRAIVLRDVEGLSTKETAEILGSTEVTVRSQISRARVKLKRYAAEECEGLIE